MIPAVYKIKNHYRGDTFNGIQFTLIDYATSIAIDLTGATIKTQFRKLKKTGAIQLELNIGTGITVTDLVGGIFVFDSITSLNWSTNTYYYDVEVTLASGDIKTYIEGTLTIVEDVTK